MARREAIGKRMDHGLQDVGLEVSFEKGLWRCSVVFRAAGLLYLGECDATLCFSSLSPQVLCMLLILSRVWVAEIKTKTESIGSSRVGNQISESKEKHRTTAIHVHLYLWKNNF